MKKKPEIIFFRIFLFFIVAYQPSFAQNIGSNIQQELKYWYYRDRLRNDFMLGTSGDAGSSIPANVRSAYDVSTNSSTILKWSDGTITLAHYIAVLVTER